MPPPLPDATLFEMVLFVRLSVPKLAMPPPSLAVVLLETVVSVRLSVPKLAMPPPVLPEIVLFLRVSVPKLLIEERPIKCKLEMTTEPGPTGLQTSFQELPCDR